MRLGMIGFAGLFSGSFWSGLRYQTPQAIEDQLKKDNPQLSVLLNQEEVIQEVKSGSNTRLQQFFASHLFEMIDLITVMPEADVHQRGHKFPFVVAQILNCDSQIILDAFFKAPQTEDSAKVNEKQEEEENLSENEDFQGDGQGVSEIKNLTQDNFESKDGGSIDSLMKMGGDGDQKKRYQDEDGEEEEDEEEFNKFQQEEENDDKGPLLIKDIDGDDDKEEEPSEEDKEVVEKKDQVVDEGKEKGGNKIDAVVDDVEGVESKVEEVMENKKQEKEDKQENDENDDNDEESEPQQPKDQANVAEQDTNDDKQMEDAVFTGDEEEKALPSLQTVQSTTCETYQRYRFQYLSHLFKFLDQKENRPASPTSSIASETTTATNTEEDNITTPQVQEKKLPEDNQLNNVLSGYFAKLIIHFVIKRSKEFFTFLSERPQCLYNMTEHLYSRGISDALMKILVCQNHGIEDSGMSLYQEMRNNVIQKIINYIDVKNSTNGIQNAVSILAELASRKPCFDIIVQPSMMEPFFEKLFDGIDNIEKKTEVGEEDVKKTAVPSIVRDLRRQGIRLVSNLMQQYRNFIIKEANKNEEEKKDKKDEDGENQDKENFGDDDEVVIGSEMEDFDKSEDDQKDENYEKKDNEPEQADEKDETANQEGKKEDEKEAEVNKEPSPFIECIYVNFDNLIKFLNVKPFEAINTISGQVMQPFGAIRLSVIEIVVEAVRINENALNNKIIESKVLTKLLHYFGEYEWNSLLHFKLDLMFMYIINNAESCSQLLHSVIEQSHLLQYVLQLAKADLYKLQNKTSREIERGFFPYILRILDALKRQSEKSSYLDDHIKIHEEEWNLVWAQKIEPKQKKYAKQLGGVNPNAKKNQNNNQADMLSLPSSSNETKKESDDDNINNKFSSFDKKGNDDDDDDQDNVENEPEEEIRNKGDMDDDDDDEDDVFGENQRYSQKMGGNRANMLASNDSYQRHRDLYVQTNNSNSNEDDNEDDMGSGNTFQGWNVDDPKTLLHKEQKTKKKDKRKKGSDLNQAFDSKRQEDENNFYMDNDEDEDEKSSQDFASFEFNSLRNDFNSSSGGFSADEFGQFQSGDEFYDAKDTKDDMENSDKFSKKEKQVESIYNDFNYWKPALQYDLSLLMNEM